ncbi:SRC kinase signaling inhibitor 1 [Elysia marginata]|uniref:SRC kinase signaling inhibitor 1 n=1 Tax=Elysia marginata TaxID=1093978 RepID=A0AAV4HP95_9GAST|nr:SRC kinase signaling inhibitor 1 [Elysia marginata]
MDYNRNAFFCNFLSFSVQPARSREVQRRRTAVVSYDPVQAAQTLEYDDLGTMSDLELPSFQRGGFMRTSLPIVRSASTSLEKPLGLVFLVCGDQTKKEIKDRSVLKLHETDSLEPQRVKERQEVRGRTVQMAMARPHGRQQPIYEVPGGPDVFTKSGSLPPQHSPHHPYQQDQWDHITRRSRSRTPEPVERPRSLSAGASTRQRISHSPDGMVTPGGTLNPIPENRQFLAHPAYRKDHPMPPPSVPPPLPGYYDNDDPAIYGVVGVQGNGTGHYALPGQPVLYDGAAMVYHDGYAVPPALAAAAQQQQTYVARSTRAPPPAHAQRAVAPGPDMRDGSRSSSGRPSPTYSSLPADPVTGNYQQHRSHSHDRREDASSRNRIEKMEQQLATLTAWVHLQKAEEASGMGPRRDVPPPPKKMGSLPSTASGSSETFPGSTSSSTSDVTLGQGSNHALMRGSSASSVSRSDTSTPVATMSSGLEAKTRLTELRSDLQILRRQQQLNIEAIREEISSAMNQIQKVITSVPGAESKVLVHKRTQVTLSKGSYLGDKQQVDKELSDLEASVEEQRNDVLSRRCRVNIVDVEGMALLLSNITKSLADLKARFPEVQSQMKEVMDAEMRVVVSEEKFLKTEPSEIERSLKRCKNLTQTLYTLKRLASAQDLQPPHIPSIAQAGAEETELTEQKHAVLESIKAMIPDHQHRVEQMEATEASRERKKKISTQQEALKFGKSLEIASKQLRPAQSSNAHNECENFNSGNKGLTCSKDTNEKVIKPPVAAKPDLLNSTPAAASMPYASSSTCSSLPSSSANHPSPAHTSTAAASSSTKPYFSGALTNPVASASRLAEKPTATVSAMTAHVSDSITTTAAESSIHDAVVPSLPSETASNKRHSINNNVSGGTGTVTQTVYRVQTPVSQRADADISTYQVCGPVNPVIPSSLPVATKASSLPGAGTSHSSLYGSPPGAVLDMAVKDSFENPIPAVNGVSARKSCLSSSSSSPPTSPAEPSSQAGKKPSVTFAETKPIVPSSPSHSSLPVQTKGSSEAAVGNRQTNEEKVDLATQKQAARNAFFSSMNTPPVSPASPSDRSSAILDPSPVLSPSSGLVGTLTPGSTINLVLAGSASPKSTSHPGSFTISPPADIMLPSGPIPSQTSEHPKKFFIPSSPSSKKSPTLIPSRQSSLDSQLAPHGTAPLASADTSSSSSESDYSGAKPKKVPPPPPPRRGSRPTSFSGMPSLSNSSSPTHKPGEMPRFVGGILGQHRLSGGPLSSTPKSGEYQDKPAASIFEKDIASGIYANMNRPDLQNQKSTPQQIISKAAAERTNGTQVHLAPAQGSDEKARNGSIPSNYEDSPPVPPPPSVMLGSTNRQERGSSSESTSSSSSTSMGSQQSVVNVVRAQSMHSSPSSSGGTGRHGTKPAPPKRQSSLLAKFTGSNKSSSSPDRKGVDL